MMHKYYDCSESSFEIKNSRRDDDVNYLENSIEKEDSPSMRHKHSQNRKSKKMSKRLKGDRESSDDNNYYDSTSRQRIKSLKHRESSVDTRDPNPSRDFKGRKSRADTEDSTPRKMKYSKDRNGSVDTEDDSTPRKLKYVKNCDGTVVREDNSTPRKMKYVRDHNGSVDREDSTPRRMKYVKDCNSSVDTEDDSTPRKLKYVKNRDGTVFREDNSTPRKMKHVKDRKGSVDTEDDSTPRKMKYVKDRKGSVDTEDDSTPRKMKYVKDRKGSVKYVKDRKGSVDTEDDSTPRSMKHVKDRKGSVDTEDDSTPRSMKHVKDRKGSVDTEDDSTPRSMKYVKDHKGSVDTEDDSTPRSMKYVKDHKGSVDTEDDSTPRSMKYVKDHKGSVDTEDDSTPRSMKYVKDRKGSVDTEDDSTPRKMKYVKDRKGYVDTEDDSTPRSMKYVKDRKGSVDTEDDSTPRKMKYVKGRKDYVDTEDSTPRKMKHVKDRKDYVHTEDSTPRKMKYVKDRKGSVEREDSAPRRMKYFKDRETSDNDALPERRKHRLNKRHGGTDEECESHSEKSNGERSISFEVFEPRESPGETSGSLIMTGNYRKRRKRFIDAGDSSSMNTENCRHRESSVESDESLAKRKKRFKCQAHSEQTDDSISRKSKCLPHRESSHDTDDSTSRESKLFRCRKNVAEIDDSCAKKHNLLKRRMNYVEKDTLFRKKQKLFTSRENSVEKDVCISKDCNKIKRKKTSLAKDKSKRQRRPERIEDPVDLINKPKRDKNYDASPKATDFLLRRRKHSKQQTSSVGSEHYSLQGHKHIECKETRVASTRRPVYYYNVRDDGTCVESIGTSSKRLTCWELTGSSVEMPAYHKQIEHNTNSIGHVDFPLKNDNVLEDETEKDNVSSKRDGHTNGRKRSRPESLSKSKKRDRKASTLEQIVKEMISLKRCRDKAFHHTDSSSKGVKFRSRISQDKKDSCEIPTSCTERSVIKGRRNYRNYSFDSSTESGSSDKDSETDYDSLLPEHVLMHVKRDLVSVLMEYGQTREVKVAFTDMIRSGPHHASRFHTSAIVDGKVYPEGAGSSKKNAKKAAAAFALQMMYEQGKRNLEVVNIDAHRKLLGMTEEEVGSHAHRVVLVSRHVLDTCEETQFINYSKDKIAATFVLEHNGKMKVVGLGTGNRCILYQHMATDGQRIIHAHAEIIARRAFLRYLYKQLLLYNGKSSHPILTKSETGKLKLRDKIQVHLYISRPPCGDAAAFPTISNFPNRMRAIRKQGQLRTIIDDGEGAIPTDFTVAAGVNGKERLRIMTCSDKICRWNVLGVQGALLSHFLDPIYLTSLVIGSHTGDQKDHVPRAISGRLKCGRLHEVIQRPYKLNCPEIHYPHDDLSDTYNITKSKQYCITWTLGDDDAEVIDAITGLVNMEPLESVMKSRVSKMSMSELFQRVCEKYGRENLAQGTYAKAKKYATTFQRMKSFVGQHLVAMGFGQWYSLQETYGTDDFESPGSC